MTPAPAVKKSPNTQVYSLNERDVTTGSFTSMSGQLLVYNILQYALIDLEATVSYIASRL